MLEVHPELRSSTLPSKAGLSAAERVKVFKTNNLAELLDRCFHLNRSEDKFSNEWVGIMILIQRPEQNPLQIESILLDFEGTLAIDRRVHPKAKDKINLLSKRIKIYILTKGNQETVSAVLKKVKAEIIYLGGGEVSQKKLDLLRGLGASRTVAIGNGFDDASMLEEAGLGICVISREGTSAEVVQKADVVFTDILDALDFLLKPLRHQSTLGT